MKKNSKSKVNTAKKAIIEKQYDRPGRPKYSPKFPKSKEWTFTDWMIANDIDTDSESKTFGKGPLCSMLTLRKAIERDMYFHKKGERIIAANRTQANPRSIIIAIRGITAESNSKKGLGRRALLFSLRAGKDTAVTAVTKVAKVAKEKTPISKSQTPTADKLDAIHAILATPEIIPSLTIPAVTITPEVVSVVTPAIVAEVTLVQVEVAPEAAAAFETNQAEATPEAIPVLETNLVNI